MIYNKSNSIRIFCDRVCMKIKEPKETLNDIHEELSSNMEDEVQQLIENGLDEKQAIIKTIQKHGSPQHVVDELSLIYKTRRFILPVFGITAISLLIISVFLISIFYYWNYSLHSQQIHKFSGFLMGLHAESNHDEINEAVKEFVSVHFVDDSFYNDAIWLGVRSIEDQQEYTFVYPPSAGLNIAKYPRTEGIFTQTFFSGVSVNLPNTNIIVDGDIAQVLIKHNVIYIGFFMFLLYWVTFSIWALNNIKYINGKNTMTSTALIVLFNFIGFIIYYKYCPQSRKLSY
ncbi:hypothetical protein AWH56_018200 [Anaerobacillus isosaccharinicus]|uniref:Uncharacterized protein n=1 Tax=Anaerobacillus isosaccharinicus TaxID=1532552 RepID=A0A1S2L554_9BACI|nr:hypothetical protein [Anaerobacillus isosaccharinicus]MBA5587162.1 hypothetical protein [Anaerobacillus isosaccharinicus]QOY34642.1 hypothetical protein AWH56_018200 [Anaerobacillus isosaccharinicus]